MTPLRAPDVMFAGGLWSRLGLAVSAAALFWALALSAAS
jgi:hypothetical protein